MKAVKFTLSGKNAFFKKPEVNTYYYFTFGQIHKVKNILEEKEFVPFSLKEGM